MPLWRNIDFTALCEGHGLTKVAAWSEAVLQRPAVQTTSAGTEEMARAARTVLRGVRVAGRGRRAVTEMRGEIWRNGNLRVHAVGGA